MLKIKKIKNWYGIKELKDAQLINGNTIIYSPNGVMKSSFSDGIRDLRKGTKPLDVFNDIPSEYLVEINGVEFTDESENVSINAIIFGADDKSLEIYSDDRILKLMLSVSQKEKYIDLLKSVDIDIDEFKRIFSVDIANENRYNSKILNKLNIENPNLLVTIKGIINLIDSIDYKNIYHLDISKMKYFDVFDEKTLEVIKDKEFADKIQIFNNVVEKEINKKVFNNGFTLEGLMTINNQLGSNNYFEAGHTINLKDEKFTKEELINFINREESLLYETGEVKALFDEAKKIIAKNANSKLLAAIEENKWIMKELSNVELLRKKIINTKAIHKKEELTKIRENLKKIIPEFEKVLDSASEDNTVWKTTLEKFNQRFINEVFTVEIKNISSANLNLEKPQLEWKLINSNIKLDESVEGRLSNGEKRIFYILSLIYEIEIARLSGEKFVVILDDIVDSFDYKNKFSTIEYLKELSKDPNIQLIILSHNFDFYRSCRIALEMKSKLLAYKEGDSVKLWDAKTKELDSLTFIQNWKNNKTTRDMISLLPFLRNIYEINKATDKAKYNLLSDFLHYKNDHEILKLDLLSDIFNDENVEKHEDYALNTYSQTLKAEAEKILGNSVDETKLSRKILLGIYLRILSDKLLYKRYVAHYVCAPTFLDRDWTKKLNEMTSDYLTPEEKALYNRAVVIAPTFIHVNAFMFEPLVDVDTSRMKSVIKDLENYLDRFN